MGGWGTKRSLRPFSSDSPFSPAIMPAMPPKTGADLRAGLNRLSLMLLTFCGDTYATKLRSPSTRVIRMPI